jgi:hypothetical protein
MSRGLQIALWMVLTVAARSHAAENIWVEGEEAKSSDFARHGWYDSVAKEAMSGKQWLSHYDPAKPGTATWEFQSKEGGDFVFWLRCNYFACEMDYQLNGAAWKPIDLSGTNVRDGLMISPKPDHRFLGWVKVGTAALAQGPNTLSIKIHSKLMNHGGIDCFVFSNTGFIPSGAVRPGKEDAGAEAPDPDAIWREGEDPDSKDVTRHGWYHGMDMAKEGLSGKEWLSHYDANKPGSAKYSFEVKKAKDYVFWLRCNPFKAKIDYKLDDADFKPVDLSGGNVRDNLRVANRVADHRFIAWAKIGAVQLAAGRHTVEFKLDGEINHSTAIDCFVFAGPDFVPSGAQKPMIATGAAGPDAWFRVIADVDAFSEKSLIDMSKLIPAPAGQFGFLQRDGKDLRFQKGATPVKFWGVCAGCNVNENEQAMAVRARYYAKHGINMVRQHPVFDVLGPLRDGRFEANALDTWDRWFAALKKQGIYMTWSVFYPLRISESDGYPPELLQELEGGRDGLRSTYGVVNFSRKLQDLQIAYVKALLEHVNPYTKLAYKDDPALAVLEVHNEDCIFFHNPITGLANPATKMPNHARMLRQMFCEWAKSRYGNDEALRKAWGTRDSLANGEIPIYGAWQLGAERRQVDSKAKLGDYIRFLTDVQRGFYDRRTKEYREAGYKAVTVTTAWFTEVLASPANLYCDCAGDLIDRHNYSGGGAGGHGIAVGKVNNATHMGTPGGGILSSGFFQVEDRPFAMTEWTQSPPNQWKPEIAPLFAFYGMGLQGWDSSYHFASGATRIGDGWPGLSSYCTDTPHYIGQFPALAFALYKGHIQEAPLAAARRLKMADLFTGDDPLVGAALRGRPHDTAEGGAGYDQKQITGAETPNEVLAIGRVTVSFDGKAGEKVDWAKYWDKERQVIRSMTGELAWDYGRRIVTLTSPKTQAIIGFAGGTTHDLPGARVAVKTPFVSIILTPLDDKPLAESASILITAMARDKQSDSQYNADGTQLLAIGGPPLLMEPVQATITLKGPAPRSVDVLDIYGVPNGQHVKTDGSAFTLDGSYRTYYYHVKR